MMMSKRHSVGALLAAGCCIVLWMPAGPASADTILLDDTFDVPVGAATRGDDVADSLDTAWYTVGPGATSSELSLVADTTINSGNAFEVAGNALNSRVWGGFPSVTLTNVGDYLQLSFDINVRSADDTTTGLRFGFYDSATDSGAPPTADKTDDIEYLASMDGYVAMMSTGGADPYCLVRRETSDENGRILSSTPSDTSNYDVYNGAGSLTLNVKHTVSMKLTKTDTGDMGAGMRTTLTVDGSVVLDTIDDGSNLRYDYPSAGDAPEDPYGYLDTFDGVVIGGRPTGVVGAKTFRVDNVRVATNVPEPGAILLLAVGVLMFAVRRGNH